MTPVARGRWGDATRGMVASMEAGSAGAFRYCPSLCDHRIRAPGSCATVCFASEIWGDLMPASMHDKFSIGQSMCDRLLPGVGLQ